MPEDFTIVHTWEDLIDNLDTNLPIIWEGASRIESVVLDVALDCESNGFLDAHTVPSIDFGGLTIGTLTTHASDDRDFRTGEGVAREYKPWLHGFSAVYVDGIHIYNLTIEHIVLEHPRDILTHGGIYLKNVYCYDIYAPSVENTSPWLKNAGIIKSGGHWRAMSNYILGTSAPSKLTGDERTMCVQAEECIFKIRTENAGITLAAGIYRQCEIDIDYTFTWGADKVTEDWELLSVFPAPDIEIYVSTVTGTLRLKSAAELLMAERACTLISGQEAPITAIKSGATIYNLRTIAENGFSNLIIENTRDYLEGKRNHWIDYSYGSRATTTSIVTNNGNYHLTNVNETFSVLLGDMRNTDILEDRGYDVVADDGERESQYDSTSWTDGYWTRKIYSATNDGLPFLPFWYYPYGEIPEPTGYVEYDYICIFDMETPQNGFDNNGLAILEPTQCRVTEELNGGWNLTLVHPKDPQGKWKYILEMNIIRCLSQLFIIRKVVDKNTVNSQTVTAYAEHITYHLNDYWLFPGTSIAGYQGQTLINSILAQMWDVGESGQTRYTFDITTTLNSDPSFKEWYEMPEGHTPYEMILGPNGFTSLIGGELYRYNFEVRINTRMWGADDHAFVLHPDLNLKAIEKTVDVQTFCTYFRAYAPDGTWWAVAWDPTTLPRAYPHNIVRSQNFTFDVDDEYYSFDMLVRKGRDYFGKHCAPLISFRISVQDLKNHPEYKEFTNNYRFKVGDIGKVWDDEAGRYYDLEITKTVKDGITGECLEVVIGTERSFTRPANYPVTLDRNFNMYVVDYYDPDNPPEPPEPPTEETTVELDYLYEVNNNDEITLLLYIGTAERITVPSVGDNNKVVTKIASSCFDGAFQLIKVVIPEGIEVIE